MKLSLITKASFGLGAFGKDIFSVVVMSYVMIFYTDVFGLTASLAGMVLLVTRLLDAFSNPFIGLMMDRTKTRWGRFRPYLLVTPIPFALFTVLMFWKPELSMVMKFAYALITFNIAGLCFTCIDVAIWGLMPNLSRDEEERSQLISLGRAFSNLAGMLFAPLVIPLIIFMGKGNDETGYLWLGVIVGGLSIVFCWLLFFNSREIPFSEVHTSSMKALETMKRTFRNKNVICVILAMIAFGISVGLQNATGVYYLKYYLKLPDMIPVYFLMSYSFKVLGALLAPKLMHKAGNANAAFYCFIAMGAISFFLYFSPQSLPVIYFILTALFSLGIGILLVSITAMMAEAADLLASQSGGRNDGMLFSLNALSMQTGFALSAALAGFILQLSGYQANQPLQSPLTMHAINFVRCLAPALFCITVLFAFKLWTPVIPLSKQLINSVSEITKESVSHD